MVTLNQDNIRIMTSKDGLMQQAHHVWAMLDDMAAHDPQAYRAFIDKQIQEGREAMKPPQPHMCVLTKFKNSPSNRFYINILDWVRIPGPKDDQEPIPVMGGNIYDGRDSNGLYKCVAVGFNPGVLQELGRQCKNYEEQQMLINLALDYLQDQHKVSISRDYTLLGEDTVCKGPVNTAVGSLQKKSQGQDDEFQQTLSDLENSFGPLAAGSKDSLLNSLSDISVQDRQPGIHQPAPTQGDIRIPGTEPSTNKLVHELPEHTLPEHTLPEHTLPEHTLPEHTLPEHTLPEHTLPEPVYEIKSTSDRVEVKISLPGVRSVGQCELDISQDDVQLVVQDQYQLNINLPHTINEATATAKYTKKSSVLTLCLPIQDLDR